jgi:hypothetical protein
MFLILSIASLMHNEQLVCTFFLGLFGFLSKTDLSRPSQQGKEGLDKSDWTDSSMTPNNCVCHWTGWVEVTLSLEGEGANWQYWSGHKP